MITANIISNMPSALDDDDDDGPSLGPSMSGGGAGFDDDDDGPSLGPSMSGDDAGFDDDDDDGGPTIGDDPTPPPKSSKKDKDSKAEAVEEDDEAEDDDEPDLELEPDLDFELDLDPELEEDDELVFDAEEILKKAAMRRQRDKADEAGSKPDSGSAIDLITIAGMAQWCARALSKIGRENFETLIQVSELTGRISPEAKSILTALIPLFEGNEEDIVSAKEIVGLLAQLDGLLATKGSAESRILPFLMQDDMDMFPFMR